MVRTVTGAPDRPDAAACNHTCPVCNRMSPACNRTCQALLIDMTPPPGKDGVQGRRQFVQFIFDAQACLHLAPAPAPDPDPDPDPDPAPGPALPSSRRGASRCGISRCAGSSARATPSPYISPISPLISLYLPYPGALDHLPGPPRRGAHQALLAPRQAGTALARTPARPHSLARSLTHSTHFFHLEPLLHLPTLLTSLLRHSHAC